MKNNNTPQLLVIPFKPVLIKGLAQRLPVLIRVQAPDPAPTQGTARMPYHLSLVIDRSGSMSGPPIVEAIRCANYIVDRLAPTDVASLVVFDDRVRMLVSASPVGDRKRLHLALAQVHPGGSTNLHGGWDAGMNSLLPQASEASVARVILLSDGNANVGEITETEPIATLCAMAAERGVTTSTYGLGRDFNEDLMVSMASRGGGNHYYGDTASDLFEPFAEEFDLIASLFARRVRLSLSAPEGVKIRLMNDFHIDERDGFPVVALLDIPWGAEAWAMVELEIPAELTTGTDGQFLQAAVSATTPDGQPIAYQDAVLNMAVLSAQAWDATLPDPLVMARQLELEAGLLLAKARTAVEQGDWDAIKTLIAEAKQRFADHPWVMEMLSGLADLAQQQDVERFSKESLYSSRKLRSRVSSKSEMLASLVSEAEVPSFLRRKKAQGKSQFPPPEASS